MRSDEGEAKVASQGSTREVEKWHLRGSDKLSRKHLSEDVEGSSRDREQEEAVFLVHREQGEVCYIDVGGKILHSSWRPMPPQSYTVMR